MRYVWVHWLDLTSGRAEDVIRDELEADAAITAEEVADWVARNIIPEDVRICLAT